MHLSYENYDVNFNILLHGMFAIMFYDSSITLLLPHVGGDSPHVYKAGSWRSEETLCRDVDYGFTLPGATTIPNDIDETKQAVVRSDRIVRNSNKPHCSITLPIPHHIVPLRSVASDSDNKAIFTDAGNLHTVPSQLPLVTMLSYKIGTNNMRQIRTQNNFHIFAEPEDCPQDPHSMEALKSLKSLFDNLDHLDIDPCLTTVPLSDPSGTHIPDAEKLSLPERDGQVCDDGGGCNLPRTKNYRSFDQGASGNLGIHVTNCLTVLFMPSTSIKERKRK